MNLNLKGFSQLVEDMGAALQSSASKLIDVSVGSVIRAIFEANASVVLWLQWLILQVLQTTRASTSSGSDLDTWMLDFGLSRLPAVCATGIITISRFSNTLSATIPIGTLVKTTDGTLSFSVIQDQTSSIWHSEASAYVLPSGVTSADLPVICMTSGIVGNVLAGTITVIAASLPGVDQVTNENSLSDGADAESDPGFRNRFQNFLASRSRATLMAIQNAIANVQQGLDFAIEENTGPDGAFRAGSFLVIVDDGSGYPPSALLSTIATAVDAVRPIGTTFVVVPPKVVLVNVLLTAVLTPAASASVIISNIQNSVGSYLDRLPIGRGASITRVAQNAYLGGSAIENISNVQLNGSSLDIIDSSGVVVKAGQIVVMAQ